MKLRAENIFVFMHGNGSMWLRHFIPILELTAQPRAGIINIHSALQNFGFQVSSGVAVPMV